ncbi:MAG: DUF979 domain-containing protein [Caulobacteraceae bacterium]
MIGVRAVYLIVGAFFAVVAITSARDRGNPKRWRATAFWGLFAASFLAGDRLGSFGSGVLAIAMVAIGGLGLGASRVATTTSGQREASAARFGDRLFVPILIVPVVTLAGTLALPWIEVGGAPLVEVKQVTVISMALGTVVAAAVALAMFRPPPGAMPQEGRRLVDQVGWAAILPQLLAALGAVFAAAGVGQAIGGLIGHALPHADRLAVVAVFCVGMALFTMIMGNAFAAFPVLAAGIGCPLIVRAFGGNPAIVGSIGMLSGYCGTLMTPMASHNIIPTALLGLPPGAVIRAQAPTALIVLTANVGLMYFLAFRF